VGGCARPGGAGGLEPVNLRSRNDHGYVTGSKVPLDCYPRHLRILLGMRGTFPKLRTNDFSWQEGFGAFSIGISGVDSTVRYIQAQEKHHRKKGYREELKGFLKKHGLTYTEDMLD